MNEDTEREREEEKNTVERTIKGQFKKFLCSINWTNDYYLCFCLARWESNNDGIYATKFLDSIEVRSAFRLLCIVATASDLIGFRPFRWPFLIKFSSFDLFLCVFLSFLWLWIIRLGFVVVLVVDEFQFNFIVEELKIFRFSLRDFSQLLSNCIEPRNKNRNTEIEMFFPSKQLFALMIPRRWNSFVIVTQFYDFVVYTISVFTIATESAWASSLSVHFDDGQAKKHWRYRMATGLSLWPQAIAFRRWRRPKANFRLH